MGHDRADAREYSPAANDGDDRRPIPPARLDLVARLRLSRKCALVVTLCQLEERRRGEQLVWAGCCLRL